jgi:hypothetical protein
MKRIHAVLWRGCCGTITVSCMAPTNVTPRTEICAPAAAATFNSSAVPANPTGTVAANAHPLAGNSETLASPSSPKTRLLMLTDFSGLAADPQGTTALWSTGPNGGTFIYPFVDPKGASTSVKYPLAQDFSGGSWHITGTVGTFSGFGLWISRCQADLSAYRGMSFKISGNVGPTAGVTLCVGTPATNKPFGKAPCPPSTATCIDGTTESTKCKCATARIGIAAASPEVTVFWTDLRGGYPENSPNPAMVSSIAWWLDWDARYTAAQNYAVDFTVDDITLVP